MKAFISVLMFFASALALGCATSNQSSPSTTNADNEAIANMVEYGITALRKGDIETYLNFFEEEAVWIPPESGLDVTKEQVREEINRAVTVYDYNDLTARIDEIIIDRDLAVARVSYSGIRPKYVSHIEIFTRHMYLLRRQNDGSWKIARNMWIGRGGE